MLTKEEKIAQLTEIQEVERKSCEELRSHMFSCGQNEFKVNDAIDAFNKTSERVRVRQDAIDELKGIGDKIKELCNAEL